jgi:hypothetical protein
MSSIIYKELPIIQVDKSDLPYPNMIRNAFDLFELCGAVKFIPKNDKTIFAGYKADHYETMTFNSRVIAIKQHCYANDGHDNILVSKGSELLPENVVFSEYVQKYKSTDQYLSSLEDLPNDQYGVIQVQGAVKCITSCERYEFIYGASRAQSATNTCGAFHFNNFNDLLSNVDCRDAYVGGINSPFVYYNICGAIFPFHRDPIGTGVCNINCYGKPNIWYLIPPQNAKIFMAYI